MSSSTGQAASTRPVEREAVEQLACLGQARAAAPGRMVQRSVADDFLGDARARRVLLQIFVVCACWS